MQKYEINGDEIKQSLSDRLQALKNNQENWKNRVNKINDLGLNNKSFKLKTNISNEQDKNYFDEKSIQSENRSLFKNKTNAINNKEIIDENKPIFNLSERLNQLEKSSNEWKNKIQDKDNQQYTITGKMNLVDYSINNNLEYILDDSNSPKISLINSKKKILDLTPVKLNEKTDSNEISKKNFDKIKVPKIDDNLNLFFKPITYEKSNFPNIDLDEIFCSNSELLIIKKKLKLKRKATTGNHLKRILQNKNFNQDSYEQSSILEKHNFINNCTQDSNTKCNSLKINNELDATAKAGLASVENFENVANKLKKSNDFEHLNSNNLLTANKNNSILIQIKGRKKIYPKLIKPSLNLINEGDSYILVTCSNVFVWIGRFTNILERNKVADLGKKIFQRKELGFKNGRLITIDNEKSNNFDVDNIKLFENLLKIDKKEKINFAGPANEDELFENEIIKSNKVYIVDYDSNLLRPYEPMWKKILSQQYLDSNNALVFDFDNEVYIWIGSNLTNDSRNLAVNLGQNLFSQNVRSDFSILYKCNQNMELSLFKEKFYDWNSNFKSKPKVLQNEFEKKMNLKCYEIDDMFKELEEPDLFLDNTHLGRGEFYHDKNELLFTQILTEDIRCWHITEYDKKEMKSFECGQFFNTETYVVRWQYRVNRLGQDSRNLQQDDSNKHLVEKMKSKTLNKINMKKNSSLNQNVTGRERYCYFYWQGKRCSIANKGASALMAVELDKEKGSQVQIHENKENSCFLRLFKGNFIIYNNFDKNNNFYRIFLIKGVYSDEASLYEVDFKISSFRSKGCFVILNIIKSQLFLWLGSKINSDQATLAKKIFKKAQDHHFSKINDKKFKQTFIINQWEEDENFLNLFENNHNNLVTLKQTLSNLVLSNNEKELIIFYLSSLSGKFDFQRLICPYSTNKLINNFPFHQDQLYNANQPAFFLIDDGKVVYLWQGYFPNDENNVLTGCANLRYTQEKKCALETVLSYCKKKYNSNLLKAYLIHAGLEPDEFIHLFPEWHKNDLVRNIQLKDGKKDKEMQNVQNALLLICNHNNIYKLNDLRKKPLPDGINPLLIETYLSDEEFNNVFAMTRKTFYLLPVWKQNKLKRDAELF